MTIQQFIEKAKLGGYSEYADDIRGMLLDSLAWKAVGKVEGWEANGDRYAWLYFMHRMIDALADGKTISDFLATLTRTL